MKKSAHSIENDRVVGQGAQASLPECLHLHLDFSLDVCNTLSSSLVLPEGRLISVKYFKLILNWDACSNGDMKKVNTPQWIGNCSFHSIF